MAIRRVHRRLVSLGLMLAALLVASPLPASWLIREAPIEGPDAILSLASHERERFAEVAAQARRWPRAMVLLTVPVIVNKYNCDACPHRAGWLETLGVSRDRIVVLAPHTKNSRDEVRLAAAWLKARGFTRLLAVTSPYHTRRVTGLLRSDAQGLVAGVTASPADGGLRALWWTHHYGRFYVTYEYAALAVQYWRLLSRG